MGNSAQLRNQNKSDHLPVIAEGERQTDQTIASFAGRNGIVYLTDRRILFEYREGTVHKESHQLGVSLRDVASVVAKQNVSPGGQELLITSSNTNNGFGTNQIIFSVAVIPEQWIVKINNLLIPVSSKSSSSIFVEKEIIEIPCKDCGTLVDVFRNNTCSQCGAPAR